jgi:glycerol-3-phosphate acyltransferase PlsX
VFLDAGANVDVEGEQLARFALLGAAYARTLGMDDPRVALLSNGEEAGKGNDQVRAARPLIEALPLRFVGNVEPSGALSGACDVLVCDGFVGNVMIKAVEAAAETVMHLLKAEIRRHPTAVLGAWLLSRGLRRLRDRVAWDAHGGGVLLGTREVVVVGHGRSTPEAVCAAIGLADEAARQGLIAQVEQRLALDTEA